MCGWRQFIVYEYTQLFCIPTPLVLNTFLVLIHRQSTKQTVWELKYFWTLSEQTWSIAILSLAGHHTGSLIVQILANRATLCPVSCIPSSDDMWGVKNDIWHRGPHTQHKPQTLRKPRTWLEYLVSTGYWVSWCVWRTWTMISDDNNH